MSSWWIPSLFLLCSHTSGWLDSLLKGMYFYFPRRLWVCNLNLAQTCSCRILGFPMSPFQAAAQTANYASSKPFFRLRTGQAERGETAEPSAPGTSGRPMGVLTQSVPDMWGAQRSSPLTPSYQTSVFPRQMPTSSSWPPRAIPLDHLAKLWLPYHVLAFD